MFFSRWDETGAGSLEYLEDTNSSTSVVSFYVYGGDVALTALFARTPRTLTLQAAPVEGGRITPASSATAEDSVPYPLAAEANTGYDFTGWTSAAGEGVTVGFEDASDPSTSVTVTGGDASATANFELKTYQLTLNAAVGGSVAPAGLTQIQHGIPQDITAAPAAGYRFTGWTKTGGSDTYDITDTSAADTSVTLTAGNVTLQANFEAIPVIDDVTFSPDAGRVYTVSHHGVPGSRHRRCG